MRRRGSRRGRAARRSVAPGEAAGRSRQPGGAVESVPWRPNPWPAFPPRWSPAAAAPGWWSGARKRPHTRRPGSRASGTGPGRCRASATRTRASWLVGLAPAAHGGNRTGRLFTGDRSGDFLFASLHRTGFANQPTSIAMPTTAWPRATCTSPPWCAAPRPTNRPLPEERGNCLPYLVRELELLAGVRVIVALGAFAWDGALLAPEGGRRRARARSRSSATWPRPPSAATPSSARTTQASRTPSPAA